jgi:hypothetical protein
MIVAITILSLLFVVISILINEKNGKFLLSGYNTMSEEEKLNFRFVDYVRYFKKYILLIGISMFIVSTIVLYLINSDWSGIVMVSYLFLAIIVFIWKSNQFYIVKTKKQNLKSIFSIIVMLFLLGFILYEFNNTLKDNEIKIVNNSIEISGDYGDEIKINNLKSVTLVKEFPEIDSKISGAALEIIKKGSFKTKSNEEIKLLINSKQTPIVLIETKENKKIYYSAKEKSNTLIYNELIRKIKN